MYFDWPRSTSLDPAWPRSTSLDPARPRSTPLDLARPRPTLPNPARPRSTPPDLARPCLTLIIILGYLKYASTIFVQFSHQENFWSISQSANAYFLWILYLQCFTWI